MLTELRIQNFAIIQDLTLAFSDGLVVLTGETGAGKSIILDALNAVLGGRVDVNDIRRGADKAVIEADFRLEALNLAAVRDLLEPEGLWEENDLLTLSREIRAGGRSLARVNGRSVSLALQSELGALLADIHGQSEHLSLLKVRYHLDLLDRFAHQEDTLNAYTLLYRQWLAARAELHELVNLQQYAKDRADMLKYQIQELEAARLKTEEEADLRQERTLLANAETLHSLSRQALSALDEGADALPVTDLLGEAVHALSELARIDPQMSGMSERAAQALNTLSEIAYELRGYLENIEFNPARLDQIEERLNTLNFLKRKYGGSVESAKAYLQKAQDELGKVENVDEQINEVEQKISQITQELGLLAAKLSLERHSAAQKLENGVETGLQNLQMKDARFRVHFTLEPDPDGLDLDGQRVAFDATGADRVEFLIETNPGEGFKPLVKIASGGETSRLMLALKHVLAEADQIPTLVFDEIDQGIGGRVGVVVGQMLWQLGREHQVMCVTHLPQLAAYGDQHLRVSKQEVDGRTLTQVLELDKNARKEELAGMIGSLSAGTLQSAQDLLDSVDAFQGKIE
ncbi:MAG TPA: DNA repair protein RecN [Anaerolineaceae bacterium]|nr:DNA repair protein RecN [Anaerolineaceae bacterium]HOR83967.1 DNA repair protein RecN [Anaerolineaceae bacterium]HPL42303.1 DNA repair protein RecN [Anaerolineaceae bacterium]HPY33209.1 DNA repair protein RecN [Anaerolineaceae bacterium]HQC21107.1 DNA repair protein RecN [Anaerolineaceae bacterium]